MRPNVDHQTGIPYGVVSSNNVPQLISDIQERGRNVSYEGAKERFLKSLRGDLEDFDSSDLPDDLSDPIDNRVAREEALWKFFCGVMRGHGLTRSPEHSKDSNPLIKDLVRSCDVIEGTFDIDEVIEIATDMWNDQYQEDGDCYEWKDHEFWYRLGDQGMTVWVMKSPYVTYCKLCSPCCPNAGDLQSCTDDDSGTIAYCLGPKDWEYVAKRPVFVYPVDSHGNVSLKTKIAVEGPTDE